ncbi:MAG: hypothetical protein JNM36_12255 [Chitinophagales bacterium]|jgi:hypothetical protein|nr:hypothetical protein [Chitinophagales bacterium]
MKENNLLFVTLLMLFSQVSVAQTNDKMPLEFFVGTWEQTLETTTFTRIPIVVCLTTQYAQDYTAMVNTTFKNAEVKAYYDSAIFGTKIDAASTKGMELRDKYQVREYPTWLFFSPDGKFLFKSAGAKSSEEFLYLGETAVRKNDELQQGGETPPPAFFTSFMEDKMQFQIGNRNPEFLYNYAYKLRDFHEPYQDVVDSYLNSDAFSATSTRDMQFILDFADDIYSEPFKRLLANKSFFTGIFKDKVDEKIKSTFRTATVNAGLSKKQTAFDQIMRMLTKANLTDNNEFGTELRLIFYGKTQNWMLFTQTVDAYIKTAPACDADLLHGASRQLAFGTDNKDLLQKAEVWMQKALETNIANYKYNETDGILLYKLNKKQKAIKELDAAIAKARKSGSNYMSTLKYKNLMVAETEIKEEDMGEND